MALLRTEDGHEPMPTIEAEPSDRRSDRDLATLYARVQACAAKSRSLNEQMQATVDEIRAQLRTLAHFKSG